MTLRTISFAALITSFVGVFAAFFAQADEPVAVPIAASIACAIAGCVFVFRSHSTNNSDVPGKTFRSIPYLLLTPSCVGVGTWLFALVRTGAFPIFTDSTVFECALALLFVSLYLIAHQVAMRMPQCASLSVVFSTIVATAIAVFSMQDWTIRMIAAGHSWREFGTASSPDFFAAFLVLWVPPAIVVRNSIGACGNLGKYQALLRAMSSTAIVVLLMAIIATSSRFALVSTMCGFGFVVFGSRNTITHLTTLKRGLSRSVSAAIVIGLAAALTVGMPLISRIIHPENNSIQFRIWTWRGTVHMIMAHPFAGSGFGTYVDTYPHYALTGFTRHAHNSYLQIAAECGIPAAAALILGIVLSVILTFRRSRKIDPSNTVISTHWLPTQSQCALALGGSIVAGSVQCLIDSDLQQPFFGVAFFVLLGLMTGLIRNSTQLPGHLNDKIENAEEVPGGPVAELTQRRVSGLALSSITFGCAAVALAWLSVAAVKYARYTDDSVKSNRAGKTPTNDASQLRQAVQMAPWNGRYLSDYSYIDMYGIQDNVERALALQQHAVALAPTNKSFLRLAEMYVHSGDKEAAAATLQTALYWEPNSFTLRWSLLGLVSRTDASRICGDLVKLQQSPVVTVQAIENVVEVRYATADAVVAANAYSTGDFKLSLKCSKLAQSVVAEYLLEKANHTTMLPLIPGAAFDAQTDKKAIQDYIEATRIEKLIEPNKSAQINVRIQATLQTYKLILSEYPSN